MACVSGDVRFGMDGKACLLRSICEAAEYPVENEGLLGEILNIVLTYVLVENVIYVVRLMLPSIHCSILSQHFDLDW